MALALESAEHTDAALISWLRENDFWWDSTRVDLVHRNEAQCPDTEECSAGTSNSVLNTRCGVRVSSCLKRTSRSLTNGHSLATNISGSVDVLVCSKRAAHLLDLCGRCIRPRAPCKLGNEKPMIRVEQNSFSQSPSG